MLAFILISIIAISFVAPLPKNNALGRDAECYTTDEGEIICEGEPIVIDTGSPGGPSSSANPPGPWYSPVPNYLPDGGLLEAHRIKMWEIILNKQGNFRCETEGPNVNCYELDRAGRQRQETCEIIGIALCASLAASICAPPAAATGPFVISFAAGCAAGAYEICKRNVVDSTCRDVGIDQRRLIISFPIEPRR
jgi:hypothetical protein